MCDFLIFFRRSLVVADNVEAVIVAPSWPAGHGSGLLRTNTVVNHTFLWINTSAIIVGGPNNLVLNKDKW